MARIMVVDDAVFVRVKCVRLLTENGYDVVEAGSGAEAVEVYKASRPDGVLLDITMPDMDGLTALREIKKVDPDARVAMVTALDQRGITKDALADGANLFVVKPLKAARLLDAVRKLLE
ncbi:MAG: response regulator [Dehalococcoidia bacterium]